MVLLRKVFSVIISLIFIASFTLQPYAQGETFPEYRDLIELDESISSIECSSLCYEDIYTQLSFFRSIGFLDSGKQVLTKIYVTRESEVLSNAAIRFNIYYYFDNGISIDIIRVISIRDNVYSLEIKENEITNYMDVAISDGNICLSGGHISSNEGHYRYSDYTYTAACPYGYSSDYSRFAGTDNTANIETQSILMDITFTAIQLILEHAFGLDNAISSGITSAIWSSLQQAAPTSYGISCKDSMYWHSSTTGTGYISSLGAYVTKHSMRWYPQPNYYGTPMQSTEYEIRYIY